MIMLTPSNIGIACRIRRIMYFCNGKPPFQDWQVQHYKHGTTRPRGRVEYPNVLSILAVTPASETPGTPYLESTFPSLSV